MIFSIQHFLEDYFERRGFADVDQYAVRVANIFERTDTSATQAAMIRRIARMRTVFYRRNREIDRRAFETQLVADLKKRFKKKQNSSAVDEFGRGLSLVRIRLQAKRRTISTLLSEFKNAVEARAIDVFWSSRKSNALHSRPETIAQGLLAVFAKGVLGADGLILREFVSGIGFVDMGVSFGGVLHLVELKVFTKGKFTGANQLASYMKTEARKKGWLLIIDARENQANNVVPPTIITTAGSISTIVVNINPTAPNMA